MSGIEINGFGIFEAIKAPVVACVIESIWCIIY